MKELAFETRTSQLGRDRRESAGFVNVPPYRGSTVLFPKAEDLDDTYRRKLKGENVMTYGTDGSPIHQKFYEAMNNLEGGCGTWAYATGLAGCVIPFFAFVHSGSHILVTDSVYGPTRDFCETILSKMGVETEFYDPLIGPDIEKLIRPNTALIFMESPGTHSFEVQDVPAIVKVAKAHNVWTMIDNTWATPLYFNPLKIGVDVCIHAITKYIGGHSDVLMSTVTCNEKSWPLVQQVSHTMGQSTSADDIFLALRGLRSLKVRVEQQSRSCREIVGWLKQQPQVSRVLYPADVDDPGYEIWKRDFTGATALFAFEFIEGTTKEQIYRFLNSLQLFGMGYSWGGYESLIIPSYGKRTASTKTDFSRMLRLSIGLENSRDLIEDLKRGFSAL